LSKGRRSQEITLGVIIEKGKEEKKYSSYVIKACGAIKVKNCHKIHSTIIPTIGLNM
tara:strand:- start:3548 stop:3718 length:171 start_codon:yes stop_codon:yes gene_type:complete